MLLVRGLLESRRRWQGIAIDAFEALERRIARLLSPGNLFADDVVVSVDVGGMPV